MLNSFITGSLNIEQFYHWIIECSTVLSLDHLMLHGFITGSLNVERSYHWIIEC